MNITFLKMVSNFRDRQRILSQDHSQDSNVKLRQLERKFDNDLAQVNADCSGDLLYAVRSMRDAQREFRAHHKKKLMMHAIMLENAVDGLITRYQRQYIHKQAQLLLFNNNNNG